MRGLEALLPLPLPPQVGPWSVPQSSKHRLLPLLLHLSTTTAQFCTGTETFEKVTGVELASASRTPLYSAVGNTVTAECNNRCRASLDCPAFLIDYGLEACFRLDSTSEDGRELLVPSGEKTNYFEELCLLETAFPCASAEYFQTDQECRLSRESRRSQPSSYRATTQDVDYLENQCAREKRPGNCEYDEYSGQDLGFADIQMTTRSQELCGEQCDQTSAFNCRSYSYFPSTGVCRLSGDDTVSASPSAVTERAGALYYQRAPCVDLSLVCTANSMTVTLNTEEP